MFSEASVILWGAGVSLWTETPPPDKDTQLFYNAPSAV